MILFPLKTLSHFFAVSVLDYFFPVSSFFFVDFLFVMVVAILLKSCLHVFEYYASGCTICIFLLIGMQMSSQKNTLTDGAFYEKFKLISLVKLGPLLALVLTCVSDLPLAGACIGLSSCLTLPPSKTFQLK